MSAVYLEDHSDGSINRYDWGWKDQGAAPDGEPAEFDGEYTPIQMVSFLLDDLFQILDENRGLEVTIHVTTAGYR